MSYVSFFFKKRIFIRNLWNSSTQPNNSNSRSFWTSYVIYLFIRWQCSLSLLVFAIKHYPSTKYSCTSLQKLLYSLWCSGFFLALLDWLQIDFFKHSTENLLSLLLKFFFILLYFYGTHLLKCLLRSFSPSIVFFLFHPKVMYVFLSF